MSVAPNTALFASFLEVGLCFVHTPIVKPLLSLSFSVCSVSCQNPAIHTLDREEEEQDLLPDLLTLSPGLCPSLMVEAFR